VNTGLSSAVDFNMTTEQKEVLYYKGYHTANKILPIKVQSLDKPT